MKNTRPAAKAGKTRVNGHASEPAKGVKVEKPGAGANAKPAGQRITQHPVAPPAPKPVSPDATVRETHAPEQVDIGPKTSIALSVPRLKALLAVCAKKDESRAALTGIFLQAQDNVLNMIATDGSHLLKSRMYTAEGAPVWPSYLEKGIIIGREGLAKAVAYLAKDEDVKIREQVTFEYATGATSGVLRDFHGYARFRVGLIEAEFPKVQQVIEAAGASLMGGESVPIASNDGIGREYMKASAVVAKELGATAAQVIPPADSGKPWVIIYPGCEGVLHIVMPVKLEQQVGARTLALIGNGNLKGSLAALKATITMKQKLLEQTSSPGAKAQHEAVIANCKARMTAIEKAMADNTPKLAAPKADKPAAPKAEKPPKARKPHGRKEAPSVNKAAH